MLHTITTTPGNHVTLDYEVDSAAFDDLENPVDGLQIDRVQRMIKNGESEGSLTDINGNTVGKWSLMNEVNPTISKASLMDLKNKINKWTKASIKASESQKNDSMYDHNCALEKGYGIMIEEECFSFNVKVDWPGLCPRFNWKGVDYHTIDSLINAIAIRLRNDS